MLLPELEKILRRIELKKGRFRPVTRIGNLVARNAGRGMEFKEVREYQFGDDTRHIDWNVSSRMNELYVKQFHEENDKIVNIFLDTSSSMFASGLGKFSRRFLSLQMFSFLSLASFYNQDKLFLYTYSENIEFKSGLIKTKHELYSNLKQAEKILPTKKSNHLAPYEFLKNKFPRKSEVYIISDFANLVSMYNYKTLREIHSIYGVKLEDPIDSIDPSQLKMFSFENPESGYLSKNFYSTKMEDSKLLESFFRINLLSLNTKENPAAKILQFFKS
ncbi:MAG: DUF58 domain-containing protein [Leptospiraceae bacterium]|nr:DUF58 domain-containing protein [Leptospiraceae bacterium]